MTSGGETRRLGTGETAAALAGRDEEGSLVRCQGYHFLVCQFRPRLLPAPFIIQKSFRCMTHWSTMGGKIHEKGKTKQNTSKNLGLDTNHQYQHSGGQGPSLQRAMSLKNHQTLFKTSLNPLKTVLTLLNKAREGRWIEKIKKEPNSQCDPTSIEPRLHKAINLYVIKHAGDWAA